MTFWYCVAGSPLFSRPGVRPQFLDSPAVTSNSLPKSQTPTFLPANLQMSSSPESFQATDRVPERWKIWAMSTRSEPASRASSTFGTHEIVNSGPSGAEPTCCGTTVGPPSTNSTVEVLVLVEALLVRREVAGELRLRRPLELQADLGRLSRRRRRDARGLARRRRRRCRRLARRLAGGLARGSLGRGRARARSEQHGRRGHEPEDARLLPHASPHLRASPTRRVALSSIAAAPRVGGTIPNPRRTGKRPRCRSRGNSATVRRMRPPCPSAFVARRAVPRNHESLDHGDHRVEHDARDGRERHRGPRDVELQGARALDDHPAED